MDNNEPDEKSQSFVNVEGENSFSDVYKKAAWDNVLDIPLSDPKALEKLTFLERGIEEELVDAKKKGDGKRDVELTRQLMTIQHAKNSVNNFEKQNQPLEEKEEKGPSFDEKEASDFIGRNPWLNPNSSSYNANLSDITKNFVESLDEILKKEGRSEVIGTKDYFNFIEEEIKDFVQAEKSKELQETKKTSKVKDVSPTVSIRDTINKYKETEKVKIPEDRLNLWNKMDVYDERGNVIKDKKMKMSTMNEYKQVVEKFGVGDHNRFSVSVPKSFAMPISVRRKKY